jgi:hypothetical protein
LEIGHEKNPHDYGILSYLGFLIFAQGHKFLHLAEEFFGLLEKIIEDELSNGKFGIQSIQSIHGEIGSVEMQDPYILKALQYYNEYKENAQVFTQLAKSLSLSELTAAQSLYKKAMASLAKVGRSDLVEIYEKLLGENWIALLCRNQQHLGSIPLPFGEISLDLIFSIYRKIRRWWKYRNLRSSQVQKAISNLIQKLGKRITKD